MISVKYQNATHMVVTSEFSHTVEEISQYFTITIPDSQFMRKGRRKYWDGKLRLYNKRNSTLYIGLLKNLIEFAKERKYDIDIDDNLIPDENWTLKDLDEFLRSLSLPIEMRDYQKDALITCINKRRCVIESSTGSGKSLVIYSLIRYLKERKILLIVPTLTLISQMRSDFIKYSEDDKWDFDDNVHVITAGVNKESNINIFLSTWQSLYNLDKSYFDQFDSVIVDETHLAHSTSFRHILENSTNADERFGFTGTLQETETHVMTILGLLGQVKKVTNTQELQRKKILSNINIDMILLKYPEEMCKRVVELNYDEEIDVILENEERNELILNLAKRGSGNILILTSHVKKSGAKLYNLINENNVENKDVFFIYGETERQIREEVRWYAEENDNVVIIATYQVFSTGVNIKNLQTILFAIAGKSKIRNLQSIGRGLRTHENKDHLKLIDIGDDFRYKSKVNYAFKHFEERYKLYIKEGFPVNIEGKAISYHPIINVLSND
jgi:superfamily II DNA or RNA helicase